jgi:hypothetical protein
VFVVVGHHFVVDCRCLWLTLHLCEFQYLEMQTMISACWKWRQGCSWSNKISKRHLGEAKMSATLSNKENEMLDKAHNALILSLWDKVLREVSKEKNASTIWLKLENLYIFYPFKMIIGKRLEDHIVDCNKIIVMQITWDKSKITLFINQKDYISKVLKKFNMDQSNV